MAAECRVTRRQPVGAYSRADQRRVRHVRLRLFDHHACHAAAAAYASHFDSCLVVTIDGVGDGRASTVSRFAEGRLMEIGSTPAIASPGVFFEHVTHLLNMRELEDEGKVMALADYAAAVPDQDNPILSLPHGAGPVVCHRGARPPSQGTAPADPVALSERAVRLHGPACAGEACVKLVRQALDRTGERRIALAGGVTSNIKVNRRLRLMPGVDQVFVFPHMGDGGLPVGAAALAASRVDWPARPQRRQARPRAGVPTMPRWRPP